MVKLALKPLLPVHRVGGTLTETEQVSAPKCPVVTLSQRVPNVQGPKKTRIQNRRCPLPPVFRRTERALLTAYLVVRVVGGMTCVASVRPVRFQHGQPGLLPNNKPCHVTTTCNAKCAKIDLRDVSPHCTVPGQRPQLCPAGSRTTAKRSRHCRYFGRWRWLPSNQRPASVESVQSDRNHPPEKRWRN